MKAQLLDANSGLIRRDQYNRAMTLAPGQPHQDQPSREMRDKRSMLDRIDTLTADPFSPMGSMKPHAVLRGISAAVEGGVFSDRLRPLTDVQRTIVQNAGRLIL
jgi:hypothetical protein